MKSRSVIVAVVVLTTCEFLSATESEHCFEALRQYTTSYRGLAAQFRPDEIGEDVFRGARIVKMDRQDLVIVEGSGSIDIVSNDAKVSISGASCMVEGKGKKLDAFLTRAGEYAVRIFNGARVEHPQGSVTDRTSVDLFNNDVVKKCAFMKVVPQWKPPPGVEPDSRQ